jgi:NDP-sugar pyrophosphorylase family protein
MKAMLLAAGVGERMMPITRVVPKPLIPVLGRPLAPQVLSRLAGEGITEAVINLHHLPRPLRDAFGDGTALGLRALHYSLEEEKLLGTGGGLAHAADRLRGEGPILVRNSDFLSDIPLARVLAAHIRSNCLATLVVAPHRAGFTRVAVDSHGRVTGFGGSGNGAYLFTGYHVIEESVLDLIPRGLVSDIVREVYFGLAAEGRLNAYVHDGLWWEFGHPREYLDGSLRVIELPVEKRSRLGDFDPVRRFDGTLAAIGAGADVSAPRIELGGTVAIGMGVMVAEGTSVEDTVVMPEAWIGPGCVLRGCIVGPGTELPKQFEAAGAVIVTDPDPDAPLTQGIDRVAGLLIRRFSPASAR